MKTFILPFCLLGVVSGALAEDIRPQLKAMNAAVTKAILNRDIAAFSAAMKGQVAPDFKYFETPTSKPMSYDQMVANMKMGFDMTTKVMSCESRPFNFKVSGDTTTVSTAHSMFTLLASKDKKKHRMTFEGVSIDVFKKVGNTWKMSSMTWKSQLQKIDGKPMKPGM